MDRNLKVAFVQDAIPFWGGAEKVLAAALEVFPQAEVYTLVYRKENFRQSVIANHAVHTSFIDRLPIARDHHRAFLPFMPFAVERFNLQRFDVLVSFSYAVAHGIIPRPGQLHLSYMHTPLRRAWQQEPSLADKKRPYRQLLLDAYLHFFRVWDVSSSRRTDHFISVSRWIAQRVWRAYHRPSDVLYPPVDVAAFKPLIPRSDYYLVVSRLVAHKRIDRTVKAFTRLGLPLLVVGTGPEGESLKRMAGPNIRFLGWQPQDQLFELYGRARAFVHAGVEDFGIAMVEAQAAGCPVIAVQAGAAPEIIRPGETGLLVPDSSVEGFLTAILRIEKEHKMFDPQVIQENARRFSRDRFRREFVSLVERDWNLFQHGSRDLDAFVTSGLQGLSGEAFPEFIKEGDRGR